ncbi:MAG: hypothetical protein R6U64_07225, partial [Bacteroidales bacterium]
MKKHFWLVFLFCLPGTLLLAEGSFRFQQQANHVIHATLDDKNHLLHAHIATTYFNNSPDTLYKIYIHLWPNAFSDKESALSRELLEKGDGSLFFATPDQRGYIDSLAFAVNGQSVRWHHDDRHKDIAVLYPEQPLLPGDSIRWTSP